MSTATKRIGRLAAVVLLFVLAMLVVMYLNDSAGKIVGPITYGPTTVVPNMTAAPATQGGQRTIEVGASKQMMAMLDADLIEPAYGRPAFSQPLPNTPPRRRVVIHPSDPEPEPHPAYLSAMFTVTVTDLDGQPEAGVPVRVIYADGVDETVYTKLDGKAHIYRQVSGTACVPYTAHTPPRPICFPFGVWKQEVVE